MILNWNNAKFFDNSVDRMIEKLKETGHPVFLWGDVTDNIVIPFFEKRGVRICGIVDNALHLKGVKRKASDGYIEIIHPDEVNSFEKDYNVVIVVPYPNRLKKEISLLKKKPQNLYYLDVAKLHTHPSLFLPPNRELFEKNEDKAKLVEKMLEDKESKEILENVLNYWISGDHSLVSRFVEKQANQYFDVLSFSEEEVFVNVGACDGRYTKRFVEKVGKYKMIYNFEADPENYKLLCQNMIKIDKVKNCNIGIWDSKGRLQFKADGNAGSCITDNGDIEIEVDSIDNLFSNEVITFIKADIEGAERMLLTGAAKTIHTEKPKLAICCYHQMQDLIEIPYLIKKLNPDYKIMIRHYTDTLTETVCYAF